MSSGSHEHIDPGAEELPDPGGIRSAKSQAQAAKNGLRKYLRASNRCLCCCGIHREECPAHQILVVGRKGESSQPGRPQLADDN